MNRLVRKLRFVPLLLCAVSIAAIGAAVSPLQKEIATAKIHAEVVAHADSLKTAHLHLHHVINCLVGADGHGYSAAAEAVSAAPCKGLGNGAVADSASNPALHALMDDALRDAQAGVRAQSVTAARADGAEIVALLDQASGKA
ncbi:MAG: hypothetical protein ACRETQ_02305 [Gammaproteobacteria bacterium]